MERVIKIFKNIFGSMSLKKHPILFLIQFIVLIIVAYTLIPIFVKIIAYFINFLSSFVKIY